MKLNEARGSIETLSRHIFKINEHMIDMATDSHLDVCVVK